ncbi:MAG: hypothetical protein D3906_01450 [Candidatus Electrothrix sp. AUS1_2]|nr:hypothetical protein [Candidatus Electrothrix sp. AUS1_2]
MKRTNKTTGFPRNPKTIILNKLLTAGPVYIMLQKQKTILNTFTRIENSAATFTSIYTDVHKTRFFDILINRTNLETIRTPSTGTRGNHLAMCAIVYNGIKNDLLDCINGRLEDSQRATGRNKVIDIFIRFRPITSVIYKHGLEIDTELFHEQVQRDRINTAAERQIMFH